MDKQNEIKVVSIRLVEEPPLYSRKAIERVEDVLDVVGEELSKYDRELFCILNLRTRNQVINLNIVSLGTLNSSLIHPREVFKSAILSNAAGIMLIHNHPSGKCDPSELDISITKKLEEAGAFLDIPVVDHIIIGEGGDVFSFCKNKLLARNQETRCVAEKAVGNSR